MNTELLTGLYRKMYKIRRFEERLLELFSENKLTGTVHTCIGQEAIAAAVMANLEEEDIVFSNHRCHGHFIAYSDNVRGLFAEIMGKRSGVCGGRGGSQHLCYRRFFSNGIQGGIVPDAVGMAWAEKIKGTDNVTVVFLGDGTLGQGVVYESLNMASVFEVPVLFVVENNEYAMSTKRSDVFAGAIAERFHAFGIKCSETDDGDVEHLYHCFSEAVSYVRGEKRPFCQIVNTYRLAAHSKGDDCRDPEEVEEHRKKDPLKRLEQLLDIRTGEEIRRQVDLELAQAEEACTREEVCIRAADEYEAERDDAPSEGRLLNRESVKNVYQINAALEEILQGNSRAIVLGEDVRDPYGGAFKVTRGLSEKFPEQVVNTPISEAGLIGIGIGLAMNGIHSIVEVMFGDFISLGFDQILNHAAKYRDMYAGQVKVPLLIRVPSGGGRGYGATHSQSLEKFFVGMPGLNIIAASPILDCRELLLRIEEDITDPTLLIENKTMYGNRQMAVCGNRVGKFYVEEERQKFPIVKLSLDNEEEADAVIITYGGMLEVAMEAATQLLLEEELLVDVVSVTMIAPLQHDRLAACVGDEKFIFTLEEGTKRAGWGAEVVSGLGERLRGRAFRRFGAADCAISCNREEEKEILPNVARIVNGIKEVMS